MCLGGGGGGGGGGGKGAVASLSKHDWIDKQIRICMDQNNYGSNTSCVQKQNILQQGTVSRGNISSTV